MTDFNTDWLFRKEGGEWRSVDLPHDAMLTEERNSACLNGINSGYFPGGRYEYVKEFEADDPDLSYVVHFEGVYRNCSIYLNDAFVKEHRYGFTAFDVELNDIVKGKNRLLVKVDNSLEPNCRWYTGSGIYRRVSLLVRNKGYIRKLKIRTISIDPAIIETDTDADEITIDDQEKTIYHGKPGRIELSDVRKWSAEDPYLYRCTARNTVDEKTIDFGIRKLEWSAEKGLRVNENEVLLRGACIHHDHGVLGACEYEESEQRRIAILKENGFNAIRMSHHPASQITLDICDRLGMYVMNELYDGWYIPKTYHDYSRDFASHWKEDAEAMIDSSFSHPSVILYSIGNEVSETANDKGAKVCGILADYVRSLDGSRPVTAGINVLLNVYNRLGMGVYKEKSEYKAEKLPENGEYKEKKSGSAFFNAMADKLGNLMFFMSSGKKGDDACQKAAETLDVLGLNYASSRYDEDVKKYPKRIMVGTETMVRDLPYNWERVKKYKQLIGDFVWSGWDYIGEACIGDWTYHSYKGLPLLAGQGMIDITGKPLASMAFMQVVWGLRDKPFICVEPLNHSKETPEKGAWQFTNAIDSWNWPGYEGQKTKVEVYARGNAVRLLLNGKEIGRKRLRRNRAVFSLKYMPGTLCAQVLDAKGNVISKSQLQSGDSRTVLRIQSEKKEVGPGEIFYVPIEFTDEEGQLRPAIEQRIDIQTENGKLLGFGSALAKTDEVFDQDHHDSYRGRALAVLKAGKRGTITITALSQGYESATETIKIKG